MKLIAFLGNPGPKYKNNRHNVGFLTGDYIADQVGAGTLKKEFSALTQKATIAGEESLFLFPQTYMNESGNAVIQAKSFYKKSEEDIVVVHDELELPFGDIRLKKDGGHKGNNGIRSIIKHLGTANFYRIRFGVGRPENPHISVADYLLSDFTRDESEKIQDGFAKVLAILEELIKGDS